jgi:hypothetical protein
MMTRRHFFGRSATGIGVAAMGSLLHGRQASAASTNLPRGNTSELPHFAAKAKRIIYLFQSGAPSQLDLFDYKPQMEARRSEELPDSVRRGQRLTGMTSNQASFPVAPSKFKFSQYGRSGAWMSELLPYTGRVADDLCIIRSMHTEAINHDPAITLIQTGSQQPGRPSLGAWAGYGLGNETEDLPTFVVLISHGTGKTDSQGLLARLWGSGFLPSKHQGVKLRSTGDPVLYLSNPDGIDDATRRKMLDGISKLNQLQHAEFEDPEILTRIAQFELAYRMQTSVPELMDISKEAESTFDMYGPESRKPGTYAANCLLARRLVERGVRFVQLYHRGWDHHGNLPKAIAGQCYDVDQSSAALIHDLKQRGLLEDTLIIWGGEFGRTIYSQGKLTAEDYGRDHHPRCFTMWLAGGGIKPGMVYGETDDYSYNITNNPVHIHDLNATVLHLLGIDHKRFTYPYQGRDFRLTDVHGEIVSDILA